MSLTHEYKLNHRRSFGGLTDQNQQKEEHLITIESPNLLPSLKIQGHQFKPLDFGMPTNIEKIKMFANTGPNSDRKILKRPILDGFKNRGNIANSTNRLRIPFFENTQSSFLKSKSKQDNERSTVSTKYKQKHQAVDDGLTWREKLSNKLIVEDARMRRE